MNRSGGNSSSSPSAYFLSECDLYDDGAGKLGGPSAGLLILFITYCFQFLVGAPIKPVAHLSHPQAKVTGVPPADFFPLHLALIQLIQLFFYLALPLLFSSHFLWQNNNVGAMVTFLISVVLVMKLLLLCLVCMERYMAVVRPVDYLRFTAGRYRWGCLGVSWCVYFTMSSVAFYKHTTTTLSVVFLPALVIDTFCSLFVLKTLTKPKPGDREVAKKMKKRKREEGEQRKEGKREQKVKKAGGKGEMNSMKKKAFITIAIIQAVLTLNYLPIIITLPLYGHVPARTLKCQYWLMGVAAAVSCSYVQPLLYLHRLGQLPCTMTTQNTKFKKDKIDRRITAV